MISRSQHGKIPIQRTSLLSLNIIWPKIPKKHSNIAKIQEKCTQKNAAPVVKKLRSVNPTKSVPVWFSKQLANHFGRLFKDLAPPSKKHWHFFWGGDNDHICILKPGIGPCLIISYLSPHVKNYINKYIYCLSILLYCGAVLKKITRTFEIDYTY